MAEWQRRLWQFRMFVDRQIYRFQAWVHTRQLKLLLQAAPAVVIGLAIVAVVAHQHYGAGGERLERYRSAFREALETDDSVRTEILARKLVQLDPADEDSRYALAWLAEQRGDMQQAQKLMTELAPAEESGHPRAHFWLASSLLKSKPRLTTSETTLTVHHLTNSLRSGAHRQKARILLATVCIAVKDFEQAAVHLDAVVVQRPDLRLQLAKVYAVLGQQSQSRTELKAARDYFREQVEQNNADSRHRILWAQAASQCGDYDEAESVLLEGLKVSDERPMRNALSSLYVAMSDNLSRTDKTTGDNPQLGERLELLQKALQSSDNHAQALSRLAGMVRGSSEEVKTARALLQERLAQGEIPAPVHLMLGTSAADARQWDEARLHLELAYQTNPEAPILLNNLAWVLAFSEPPQLDRALELVNAALQLAPENPELHATRGRVLLQLERWPDAASELELALLHFSDRTRLHSELAKIYENLGDERLAERHRKLAENAGGNSPP